ncbi:M23 family metallopeptidase [Galbitalea sp. SE-J8]|uniref:M23 family metallopeptidase n=1 Tax=Galbitalea sp. SE-J8 TaxID=3054952 RepID=UPI00259C69A8|nr:M23 family metallopeptidase [Galbitalea sp. SE-J8]MDM4762183.1 M23 family metallopeptidase [Galbitalea sp. SE-J8]
MTLVVAAGLTALGATSADASTCPSSVTVGSGTYPADTNYHKPWANADVKVMTRDFCDQTKSVNVHTGWDWAGGGKFQVLAPNDGVVKAIGSGGSYGLYMVIKFSDTNYEEFAHLDHLSRAWAMGDPVTRTQVLAAAGDTGDADGVHLHLSGSAHWGGWSWSDTHFYNVRTFLDDHGVDWAPTE